MFAPKKQSLIIGDKRRCKAARCIVALLCVFTLVYTKGSIAADSEPTYFIFHGERKSLTLDLENIAVRTTASVKTTAALNAVPRGLQVNGFMSSDLVAEPASGWAVLNARNALAVSTARAQRTLGAAVVPSKAAAIHAVISSVLASGDPSIEFVSPVFRDTNGHPVVLTSRLLIGFRPNVSLAERSRLLAAVPEGAWPEITALPQPYDERWQLKTRDGFVMLARANALAKTPGVAYAEPDMMVTWHADLVPSDPGFSDSWGLRNLGQSGGVSGFDLKATSAWDTTVGSASVIVLVLDDGVQQNHPDINQIAGKDFTSDAATNPTGGPVGINDNHGTAVAGCVSERMNNGLGTTGIAPGVRIASARFATNVQPDGSFTTFDSWIINALNWGLSIGARVSNNSNGTDVPSSAVESAYNSTRANGMTHFASAGNNGTSSLPFPANIAAVNAVAAATRFGSRSAFSQYGPGLKFMAPGQAILTTDRTGNAGFVSTDYVIVDGTSFASPYAAGVAALIISLHPGITPDQVEEMMTSNCTDMGPVGYDTGFGYGMINAFSAVTAPVPSPPPPVSIINVINCQDMVFAHSGKYLYVSTSNGLVLVYNTSTHVLQPPYNLGGSLHGLDIAPDDTFLLVGQDNVGATQGTFHKIDIKTGAITNLNYSLEFGEAGGWDVAIGSNGLALATTKASGSGWTPLRQIDLATNTFKIRHDAPGSGGGGMVRGYTYIHRSGDGRRMYLLESDVSNGPIFTYSAASNTFGPSAETDEFLVDADAAVSRNGSLLGTRISSTASLATAPDFKPVHSFTGLDSGIAFDGQSDLFYGVNSSTDQIIVFDTNTFLERYRFRIGEDVAIGSQGFSGTLVVSDDGRYLALATESGIRLFTLAASPPSARLINISTRVSVQTGSNVSIAGFIISGTDPKKVLIRAIGPSLAAFGITNALQDPTLELHNGNSLLISDDNWQSAANSGEIPAMYQPPDARESAILATLQPGSYTAIMAGSNASTGVGLIEVYDFDDSVDSKLSNVSTRGFVGTDNDVLIGGFIAAGGNGSSEVVIRAMGPSLAQFGIPNFLADPTVAIYNSNGALVSSNDNWKTSQQAAIQATGLAPASDFESAILLTLPVGNYTAVVRGKNSSTGVALVETYRR